MALKGDVPAISNVLALLAFNDENFRIPDNAPDFSYVAAGAENRLRFHRGRPRLHPAGTNGGRPSFETAQDCVVAGRHADALHQPFTWAAADAMAEKINEFGRPSGAARSRGCNLGQLLDEGFTLARSVATLPTLETKLHRHSRTLRRQIL